MKRISARFLAGVAALFLASHAAAAYPERPVKLVVPFAAGGPADFVARLVMSKVSANVGQSFLIENRTGAGGNIGAQMVAKAAPDGYTLLMIVPAHAVNMTLYKNPGYEARDDFAPVALLARSPLILLSKNGYTTDVRALLGSLRQTEGSITYGSSGVGTPPHLAMEMLGRRLGVDMVHIPYRGGAPALNDLMGGQITLMFDALVTGMSAATSGKVQALAVSGSARSAAAPSTPTLQEAGVENFEVYTWYGIAAPAKTPPEVVSTLNKEIVKALQDPDVRQQLLKVGAEPMAFSSEEFTRYFEREVRSWGEAVKVSGAKVE